MFLFAVILTFLAMAAGFALYLVNRDRGEREPIGALWIAFGFGTLGVLVAGFLEFYLLPDPTKPYQALAILAWTSLGIGIIEEVCKCLPLILFIYHKRYFNEHTDGVIYFALAGLGFGLPENILYTLQYGPQTGLARIVLTPLFHAATTGIIGYVLCRSKLGVNTIPVVLKVGLTILFVAIVHGLYDFGLFSKLPLLSLFSVLVTVVLSINLFILFLRARHLDETHGLSAVGHNAYCRTCGHPNPKHNLYCSACGNRA